MQRNFILTLIMIMFSCCCLADSESRPATEAERQFFSRAIETCIKAFNGIPAWEKVDESGQDVEEFARLTVGSEKAPLTYHYYVEWADQARIDKANAEISALLATQAAGLQQTGEEIDIKQLETIAEQIAAAANAGNASEVERLNRQAEQIAAESDRIFSESDQAAREAIEKLAARDARVVIRIGINQFYQGFDAEPTAGNLADGTPFFRIENSRLYNESWVEGTTYIVFGKDWKSVRDDAGPSLERAEEPGRPHTEIQTIVIAVEAEKQRALDILNQMKISSFRDLIR